MDDTHLLINRDVMTIKQTFKEEFQLRKFGHHFESDERCFYRPLWRMPSMVYILGRAFLCVYCIVWLSITATHLSKISDHPMAKYPWPVWMTNWSYFTLTTFFTLSFILSVVMRKRSEYRTFGDGFSGSRLAWYLRLDWTLASTIPTVAVVVTMVYYIGLYPMIRHKGYLHNVDDLQLHGISLLLVVVDFMFSARPVRILHFIYPSILGCLYIIFTVIYWSVDHSRVLYPKIVDWNHPGTTLGICCLLIFIGSPLLQIFWFTMYKLKMAIFHKIY